VIGATCFKIETREQQPRRAANQFLKCGTIASPSANHQDFIWLTHAFSKSKDDIPLLRAPKKARIAQ
jgi:hypothetical protein